MFKYIVQPGDTLHFIALKFNITVKELLYTNKLADPNRIYPGQSLIIPVHSNTYQNGFSDIHIDCVEGPNYTTRLIPPGILIILSVDKYNYSADDIIAFTLFKINLTTRPLIFTYSTSQRYDFAIKDSSRELIWQWSDSKVFAQVLGSICLPPYKSLSYTEYIRLPRLSSHHFKQFGQ